MFRVLIILLLLCAPVVSSGKYWNGSSWVNTTTKRWSGSAWDTVSEKRWNGSSWDTLCTPTESPETSCSDGLDNDCDGTTDGADDDCSAGSFVGAPGDIESFDGSPFDNPEFSITNPNNRITIGSSYAHTGTNGVSVAGTATSIDYANRINADIGVEEASYSIEFWVKSPPTSSNYNVRTFFVSCNASVTPDPGNSSTTLAWRDTGSPTLYLYDRIGGTSDNGVLSANTEYKLVIKHTRNGTDTCEIYNSSLTLVDTLSITAVDRGARYFWWLDSGHAYSFDDVQFNSTNP